MLFRIKTPETPHPRSRFLVPRFGRICLYSGVALLITIGVYFADVKFRIRWLDHDYLGVPVFVLQLVLFISTVFLVSVLCLRNYMSYSRLKWASTGVTLCVFGVLGLFGWRAMENVRLTSKRKAAI
jgi:hypothetical protein